jgi:hypothetical protein
MRGMRQDGRFLGLGRVCSTLALVAALGCSEKDATKCAQALDTSKKASKEGDFTLAQKWRDYAWTYCADRGTLEALDKQLVSERAAVEQVQLAQKQAKQENDALLKLFVTWVAENRAAPDKASAIPKCDGDPLDAKKAADPKAKERFCAVKRSAGTHVLEGRYWDADHAALRFAARPGAPASCDDLGANRVVKTWDVPAIGGRTTKRSHCEFLGGALAGLHGLVSAASNAYVYVFSPAYLEKDEAMKKMVSGT